MRLIFIIYIFSFLWSSYALAQGKADCGRPAKSTLCLDLFANLTIKGSIILPLNRVQNQSNYFLNFSIRDFNYATDSLSRIGVYDNRFSVITSEGSRVSGPQIVTSFTAIANNNEFQFSRFDKNEYGLYYGGSGLERRFIYFYPNSQSASDPYMTISQRLSLHSFENIGIMLPSGAVGIEIGGTGQTEIPSYISQTNGIKLFPGTSSAANGEVALRIYFSVPATSAQEIISEYGLKFFLVLLAPLLGFLLIDARTGAQSRRKIYFIATMAILQLAGIFVYLHYYLLRVRSFGLTEIVDFIIIAAGIIFTSYVAWEKKKSKQD